jgi:hypothetical protein
MSNLEFYKQFTALAEPDRLKRIVGAMVKGTPDEKRMARNSIQAFVNAPMTLQNQIRTGTLTNSAIQAFTTSSDLPEVITRSFDVFSRITNYDLRWMEAFKERIFDETRNYFEIVDVTNSFAFDELPEGGQVVIRRFTGSRVQVPAVTYADGIGWTEQMVEDREWSTMISLAEQFQDAFWNKKSKVHYALLVDSSVGNTNNTTWQGSGTTPAEILKRDTDTIQLASFRLGNSCKDLGFGDTATTPFLIYGTPQFEGRIMAALQQRTASGIAPSILGSRNFKWMPTYNLRSSNGNLLPESICLMVLPGNKIQRGDKLQPKSYMESDARSFSQIQTVRARYGAAVAEPLQVLQFNLS